MEFIEKMARVEEGDKSDDVQHDGEKIINDSDGDFIDDQIEFKD